MKILHVSHSLPDNRVKCSAYSAYRHGYEVFFAGPSGKKNTNFFIKTYKLHFTRATNLGIFYWWNKIRKKFKEVIQDCDPEVIHAHDIIAGKLACEFNVPFIYDDHEYWSAQAKMVSLTMKPTHILRRIIWPRWEQEILSRAYAVITVSEPIANAHRKICENVYVIPNVPILKEIKDIKVDRANIPGILSSVVINRFSSTSLPHRNTKGFLKLFIKNDIGKLTVIGDDNLRTNPPIYSLGYIPSYRKMLLELIKHHIGIVPFRRHWYHKYCSLNKVFDYIHAGLLVLLNSSHEYLIKILRHYCVTFDDYKHLTRLLLYYKEKKDELIKMKDKIQDYARKNLIWEKYEKILIKAYKQATLST